MKYLCHPLPERIHTCPLSCGGDMTTAMLSTHLEKQASGLSDQYAEQYGRLGIPLPFLHRATEEAYARMALTFERIVGTLPEWAPIGVRNHERPSWA